QILFYNTIVIKGENIDLLGQQDETKRVVIRTAIVRALVRLDNAEAFEQIDLYISENELTSAHIRRQVIDYAASYGGEESFRYLSEQFAQYDLAPFPGNREPL